MIYIDYLGTHDSFTGTLEGDNWKITSVTKHQITQEKFEVGSLQTIITHLIFTVEITNEFGKSIKFDVDSGITIDGINPNDDSISYAGDSRELNYIHLKIGSSKRLSIVKGTDEEDKVSINNNLTKFLKKEMNFVRDYFNKAETIELKKQDIEKDFDNLGERL